MLPGQVPAIVQFPHPSTWLELQHFLWLVNFYRWFIRGVSGFLLPIMDMLQGPDAASAKPALAAAAELEHPQADFPVSLMVEASNTHDEAVLQHFRCWSFALLSFFSKKLTAVETH